MDKIVCGVSTVGDVATAVNGLIDSQAQRGKYSPVLVAKAGAGLQFTAGTGSPVITVEPSPNGVPSIKIVCSAYSEVILPDLVGLTYNGNVAAAIYGTQSLSGVGTIEMRVYQGVGTANYKRHRRFQAASATPTNSYIEQGGSLVVHFNKENVVNVGTVNDKFEITQARLVINPSTTPCTLWLHAIGLGSPRKSRLCVVSDDGWLSSSLQGARIFNELNIPMTASIIAERVGSSGYSTKEQLDAFLFAGNELVTHGPIPAGGSLITNYVNASEAVADMVYNRKYLSDNGLLKKNADRCYIWPQGQFQWSTGDTSLLDAALNAGFSVSRNATELGTSDLGYSQSMDVMGKYQRLASPIVGHTFAGTTAGEVTNINNIITKIQRLAAGQGLDGWLMLHKFAPNSTPDGSMDGQTIRISDAELIASAIKALVDSGDLECVTMSEFATEPNYWNQF